ncbi:hypothetical protein R83H12_00052 [Fibrobacteria bacterium R8-3-H12]
MAIESVSGGSNTATAPVRTNAELVKKEDEDSEEKVAEQKAEDEREDEQQDEKLEDVKGVDEVDTEA